MILELSSHAKWNLVSSIEATGRSPFALLLAPPEDRSNVAHRFE